MQDKKRKIIRYTVIVLLFLCGISLLVVGNFDHIQGWISQIVQTQGGRNNKQKRKPSYDYKKVKPVSAKSLAQAYMRRSNYKAVGQIALPSLKINLNIYRGVGNDELNLGVGEMKPKQKMGQGNYCLAGHNMDDNKSYFSPLYSNNKNLVGQNVYLMNYYTVYKYKIKTAYFIASSRVDLLSESKSMKKHPAISLFTCDYTGAGRLFVQGRLVGHQSLKSSPESVKKAFKLN